MQTYFDNLHSQLVSGQLSRHSYVTKIDESWSQIEPKLLPSLSRRKDRRTLGEFALHVYDSTVRERFLLNEWLKSQGREDVEVRDFGLANDGRLILNPDYSQGQPDYYIYSDKGSWKLEVKFSPVQYKLTFKLSDLRSYVDENALVLLIMGNTSMVGANGQAGGDCSLKIPNGLQWCVFGVPHIEQMLRELPVRNYREMGNKPSVQLRGPQIRKYFTVRDWENVETHTELVR